MLYNYNVNKIYNSISTKEFNLLDLNRNTPLSFFQPSNSTKFIILNGIINKSSEFVDYLASLKFLELDLDDTKYLDPSITEQIYCVFQEKFNNLEEAINSKRTIKFTFDNLMKRDDILLKVFDSLTSLQLFQISQSFESIKNEKNLGEDIILKYFINKIISICKYILQKRDFDNEQNNFYKSLSETKRANKVAWVLASISIFVSIISSLVVPLITHYCN